MPAPEVRFRVDFTAVCSVGLGKVTLLEAIARTGSLSQAAREMSMSYRRAWLLVESLNKEFDLPVASTSIGGSGGGRAVLTEFGRELISAYRELEVRIGELAEKQLRRVARHAVRALERGDGTIARQRIARSLR
jgi:molybdate transport system regulatory protein